MLMPRKNAKKKEHYVDNKQFLHELIIYRNKCAKAKEAGEPKPRVSNYIGECFLKIATHLSYNTSITSIQRRVLILLHTSHRLYTMHT